MGPDIIKNNHWYHKNYKPPLSPTAPLKKTQYQRLYFLSALKKTPQTPTLIMVPSLFNQYQILSISPLNLKPTPPL